MKRFFAITLLLALCLTLCGCGSSNYDEFDRLMQLMQQGKYDEAKAEIDRIANNQNNVSKPGNNNNNNNNSSKPDASKEITVEITPENWNQYFELRTYAKVELNGFGELDKCTVYHSIVSKDGLKSVQNKCNVTMEFTYTGEYRSATIDVSNKELTYGATVAAGRTSDPVVETLNSVGQYIGENTNDRYGEYITCDWLYSTQVASTYALTSVQVLRATGSFTYTQAQ